MLPHTPSRTLLVFSFFFSQILLRRTENSTTMVSQPFRISNYHSASPKSGIRRRVGGGVQIPPPYTYKNRRMNSSGRGRRVNRKHRDMEGEGKGDGHQHGRKPRISLWPRNSPSEEVRGHWDPRGAEPMERW